MRIRITRRRILFAAVLILGAVLIGAEFYLLSPAVRIAAIGAAESIGADEFLAGRLSDHDLKVRANAREAVLRRGAKAVPALVERLNDPNPGNRSNAAAVLAQMGPAAAAAIPALRRRAVEDDDESVLENAGEALGRVAREDAEVVLELLAMLEAPADSNRLAAIRAAARIDDARAVPLLIRSLSHLNPKVREEAAEALGEIGEESAPAIPRLIELFDDPNLSVRGEGASRS